MNTVLAGVSYRTQKKKCRIYTRLTLSLYAFGRAKDSSLVSLDF